ncbi:Lipoprotein signal peptidase [Leptospira santarosai]|uniref:Lipoprotein signal peptidase n=1 Tax=Leptospira santarosai TaxID=28183 RepID=A0A2P1QNB7_9LEPT|nr:Lipoprotein signal peptidase [Leptospira santarosai]
MKSMDHLSPELLGTIFGTEGSDILFRFRLIQYFKPNSEYNR